MEPLGPKGIKVKKQRIRPHELALILERYKELLRVDGAPGIMEISERIGIEFGHERDTIYAIYKRFRSTVDIAESYFKANAFRLAARVVRGANVEEAMEVLSRPNIGVLAPKQESGGGTGGFFLSVKAESCGAVKIGVSTAPPLKQLGSYQEDQASSVIDVQPVESVKRPIERKGLKHEHQGHIRPASGLSERQRIAIKAARERLQFAQRSRRRHLGKGNTKREKEQPSQE